MRRSCLTHQLLQAMKFWQEIAKGLTAGQSHIKVMIDNMALMVL